MALKKQVTLKTGVIAEYWKIIGLRFDILKSIATVVFGLYKDQSARIAGKEVIEVRYESIENITNEQIEQAGVSPIALCYGYMKMIEFFSNAEDC